jgi:hypothetical protein
MIFAPFRVAWMATIWLWVRKEIIALVWVHFCQAANICATCMPAKKKKKEISGNLG